MHYQYSHVNHFLDISEDKQKKESFEFAFMSMST